MDESLRLLSSFSVFLNPAYKKIEPILYLITKKYANTDEVVSSSFIPILDYSDIETTSFFQCAPTPIQFFEATTNTPYPHYRISIISHLPQPAISSVFFCKGANIWLSKKADLPSINEFLNTSLGYQNIPAKPSLYFLELPAGNLSWAHSSGCLISDCVPSPNTFSFVHLFPIDKELLCGDTFRGLDKFYHISRINRYFQDVYGQVSDSATREKILKTFLGGVVGFNSETPVPSPDQLRHAWIRFTDFVPHILWANLKRPSLYLRGKYNRRNHTLFFRAFLYNLDFRLIVYSFSCCPLGTEIDPKVVSSRSLKVAHISTLPTYSFPKGNHDDILIRESVVA
jgi:hypothetical protein